MPNLNFDSIPRLFVCFALLSFFTFITLGPARVYAQETRDIVKVDSLPLYKSLPDNQKTEVVGTLAHGTAVRVDWSVTNSHGDWCSVSSTDRPENLGFVDCNELELQSTGDRSQSKDRQAVYAVAPLAHHWTRVQKAWALAASGMLAEFNHDRHDTL